MSVHRTFAAVCAFGALALALLPSSAAVGQALVQASPSVTQVPPNTTIVPRAGGEEAKQPPGAGRASQVTLTALLTEDGQGIEQGLVWRVYKQAGLEKKIGGARMGARSYYYWFKRRGLASRSNPKPGELVIWRKGKHIGIYVGNGYAVSALNTKYDVRKHKVNWLSGFTAYLHVKLDGTVANSDDGTSTTSDYLFKATPNVNNLVVRDGAGTGHDRVAIIKDGAILAEGPPGELGVGAARYRVTYRGGEYVTDDPTTLLHELTADALARGERLEDLSVTRPSLEDVYLELTE